MVTYYYSHCIGGRSSGPFGVDEVSWVCLWDHRNTSSLVVVGRYYNCYYYVRGVVIQLGPREIIYHRPVKFSFSMSVSVVVSAHLLL